MGSNEVGRGPLHVSTPDTLEAVGEETSTLGP